MMKQKNVTHNEEGKNYGSRTIDIPDVAMSKQKL